MPKIKCPKCAASVDATRTLDGKVRCPSCGSVLKIVKRGAPSMNAATERSTELLPSMAKPLEKKAAQEPTADMLAELPEAEAIEVSAKRRSLPWWIPWLIIVPGLCFLGCVVTAVVIGNIMMKTDTNPVRKSIRKRVEPPVQDEKMEPQDKASH